MIVYRGATLLASEVDMRKSALLGHCSALGVKVMLLRPLLPNHIAVLNSAERDLIAMRHSIKAPEDFNRYLACFHQRFLDLYNEIPTSSEAATLICQIDNRCKAARVVR